MTKRLMVLVRSTKLWCNNMTTMVQRNKNLYALSQVKRPAGCTASGYILKTEATMERLNRRSTKLANYMVHRTDKIEQWALGEDERGGGDTEGCTRGGGGIGGVLEGVTRGVEQLTSVVSPAANWMC